MYTQYINHLLTNMVLHITRFNTTFNFQMVTKASKLTNRYLSWRWNNSASINFEITDQDIWRCKKDIWQCIHTMPATLRNSCKQLLSLSLLSLQCKHSTTNVIMHKCFLSEKQIHFIEIFWTMSDFIFCLKGHFLCGIWKEICCKKQTTLMIKPHPKSSIAYQRNAHLFGPKDLTSPQLSLSIKPYKILIVWPHCS